MNIRDLTLQPLRTLLSRSTIGTLASRCLPARLNNTQRALYAHYTLRSSPERVLAERKRQEDERYPQYGCELTAEQWSPVSFAALDLLIQKLQVSHLPLHTFCSLSSLPTIMHPQLPHTSADEHLASQAEVDAEKGDLDRQKAATPGTVSPRRSRKPQKQQDSKDGNFFDGDLPKKLGFLFVSSTLSKPPPLIPASQ